MAKEQIEKPGNDKASVKTEKSTEEKGNAKALSGDHYERLTLINKILKGAQDEITDACRRNESQILALSAFCGIMLVVGVIFACKLLDKKNIPSPEDLIYVTFTRAIIVAGVFYIATFTFKILKSYLHIHQRNTHRLMVVKSMASFVGYQTNADDIQKTYNLLLDIIVNFDKNGILKEDDKSSESSENEIILELLKKIPSISKGD